MAVCRIEKNKNYTVMSNYHLTDDRLSLKAVGLLSKILSLPESWDYTVAGLAAICREGRDAIRAALEELEQCGYIVRRQLRDETGAFANNEYVIHEYPQEPQEDEPEEGERTAENPLSENPASGNPAELNTKLTKYLKNNPPIVPPEGTAPKRKHKNEPKDKPDWNPERFAGFWEHYPRGEDKQAAIRAWDKLQPDDALINRMALALMRQMASQPWTEGIGIPYASTWINQRRWEDEVKQPKADQQQAETPKGTYWV